MYQIKQIPEDFIVKEINKLNHEPHGSYSYYSLSKRDYTTIDAVKKICKAWKISEKFVNFAGTKDKAAQTIQFISIKKGPKKNLDLKDIELKFLDTCKERLNLGRLTGNEFEITVRNIDKKPKPVRRVVNFFDSQRFGRNKDNHIVGKCILKGDFKKACERIGIRAGDNDYIRSLRSISRKNLKFYLHAYQSHLWNEAAKEIMKKSKNNIKIPIIGFGTEFQDDKIERVYKKIMKDEKISQREFINRKIPELSEEGSERDLYVEVKELNIGKLENDELNIGKKKVKIMFSLPPGAYATNVIKNLMKHR